MDDELLEDTNAADFLHGKKSLPQEIFKGSEAHEDLAPPPPPPG